MVVASSSFAMRHPTSLTGSAPFARSASTISSTICCPWPTPARSYRQTTAVAWRASRAISCRKFWILHPPCRAQRSNFGLFPGRAGERLDPGLLAAAPDYRHFADSWSISLGVPRHAQPYQWPRFFEPVLEQVLTGDQGITFTVFFGRHLPAHLSAPSRRREPCAATVGRLSGAYGRRALPRALGTAARHAFQSAADRSRS